MLNAYINSHNKNKVKWGCMDKMQWSQEWELGIESIDQQHRQIVDYINELTQAIDRNDHAQVLMVLDHLRRYTLNHFTFEEQLMAQAGFAQRIEHEAIHRHFESRVAQFQFELDSGRDAMGIARRARNTLKVWLIEHIKHEDAAYVASVDKWLKKENGWIRTAIKSIFG